MYTCSVRLSAPKPAAYSPTGPPATRCTACAIAAISAARLSVLAVSSSPTTAHSTIGGKSRLMLAARPRRVTADARADELDRDHQRQRQRHGPQHRVAELRAGLGIGGDAAGIVVRRAGDQAGAQRRRADGRGAPARASRPSRILQPGRATGHCESLRIQAGARLGQLPDRAAQAGARGRPGRSHAGAARARAHPSPGCSGRCR